MKRSDVEELFYITDIGNLFDILKKGILCHSKAKKVKPKSIADPIVQERREKVVVPGANKKLHDYANLYFNPRNPMMFKRKDLHEELCILRVSCDIFDEQGVIITDGNAASGYTLFLPPQWGFASLDEGLIYARYWNDEDPIEKARKTRAICAEVLVPGFVDRRFIKGIYVSCVETQRKVTEIVKGHPLEKQVTVEPIFFFVK